MRKGEQMKKNQNTKKKLGIILLGVILCFSLLATPSFADVGSFESYDSGGSSWSSSDWGGSSYSSGSSYRSGSSSGGGSDLVGVIVVVVIIVCIIISKNKHGKNKAPSSANYYSTTQRVGMSEPDIVAKLKAIDPEFNKEEFIAWSKTLFVKLQQAWTARDWEVIRTFETKELFEQHKSQLQGYIDNNTINVMDRICVNYAKLYQFKQEGGQDILTVELNSRMKDYIIDATTKKVLQGDKVTERTNTYLLTFVRTTGVVTQKATGEVETTNCPNCGAPTKITSAGKCEYCGSVITTDTHDWALANLQRK